jgi:hypothetical protein
MSLWKYQLLRQALARYEHAKAVGAYYVSQVSRGSKGRGHGADFGREIHRKIWGLDPEVILGTEEVSLPFPLAWRFRFGWLIGVADFVTFQNALPVEVIEVKSYDAIKRYEAMQASLYGLLVTLNFAVRPRVYVRTPRNMIEIEDWENLALQALSVYRKQLKGRVK